MAQLIWTKTNKTLRTGSPNDANGRVIATQVEMARLVGVIAALREHCPWTAALTHESLTTYLIEESYELIEEIESGDGRGMANELGDILLQVVLHARLAEEAGSFDLADVVRGLSEKMIRRSPHVFHPDGTLQESFPATLEEIEATWERVKAQERAAALDSAQSDPPKTDDGGTSAGAEPQTADAPETATNDATKAAANPYAGIPSSLPALAMAQKTLERAARAGHEMPAPALILSTHSETEEELGKVLFDVVRAAQERGLDAERALRRAVADFQARSQSARSL